MLPEGRAKIFAAEVAALVHADKKKEAALRIADFAKISLKLEGEDPSKTEPVLISWLHYLLDNKAPEEAAQLLWSPTQFNPAPSCTRDVWKLYEETSMGLIMGGGSVSKSFGLGVRLFLEWTRDPCWTSIRVAGPSQQHLESNLFSHLISLHRSASLVMPGEPGELFIGEDRRDMLGSISGIVIPLGKLRKSGRLQGTKRKPRPKPHPKFGPLSRLFVFIDETEQVPSGIWKDIDNILSQVTADVGGFKIFCCWNPQDQSHEVATRAEPLTGWENFNIESDYHWRSKRGWDCLRLDAERTENVIEGRVIFPGLQTREGLAAIARNAGGTDSPGYITMARGAYPVQGAVTSIIPVGMFQKSRGEFLWTHDPEPIAACDLALEGGASACFSLGRWGVASGQRLPPNLDNPKGRTVMFKNEHGQVTPRHALQVDQQFVVPKGDSVEMAQSIISLCKKSGVKPRFFCCDRTGVGGGTADIMRHSWGSELHDVNYSEGPSDSKMMSEDSKTCKETYDRLHSELWFGLRAFFEFGYILLSPSMEITDLQQQCTQRLVKHGSHKSRIESKSDYKSRGHKSPDEADSLTLLVHAARKGSGVTLSRLGEAVDADGDGDGWYDAQYKGGARITADNRQDYLT
jgi:hypothetical protein